MSRSNIPPVRNQAPLTALSRCLRCVSAAKHQVLKHLRQYWCYGNCSVIGNRRGWWTFWNWGDIGLSPARQETTQTNKPPKHYTKTGAITSAVLLRKRGNIPQWVGATIRVQVWRETPLLTRPKRKGGKTRRRMTSEWQINSLPGCIKQTFETQR